MLWEGAEPTMLHFLTDASHTSSPGRSPSDIQQLLASNILRQHLQHHPRDLEHAERPEMVCFRNVAGECAVRPDEHELGQVCMSFQTSWKVGTLTFGLSEICGADAEERSIVLGLMNAIGYAFNAWLPYLSMLSSPT